jgi:hypothetical protein
MELSADRQQWHWVVSDPIAGRKLGSIELSATLAVLIGGLAAMPARADEDDRGHNVQQQEGYDHDYGCPPAHRSYQHYYYRYEQPSYVYAPPPVYYAPPPRQPAIDFIFPLNFR